MSPATPEPGPGGSAAATTTGRDLADDGTPNPVAPSRRHDSALPAAAATLAAAPPGPVDAVAPVPAREDRPRRAWRRRRFRWVRRAVIAVVVVVVVVVGVVATGTGYVVHEFAKIPRIHRLHHLVKPPAAPAAPFTVLLVGSDSRSFVDNSTEGNAFGSSSTVSGQRSDVIIIARVAPAEHRVELMSIPRDTWVTIPGNSVFAGQNRINAAYNNGPDLLIQTIELDFHIPINYYAQINFAGFSNMVDALGGIYMDFPDPVFDHNSGLHVTRTGCQLVNGTTALALVRSRDLYYVDDGYTNYDVQGDFSRIRRQDEFFRAMLSRLNSSITNVFGLNDFLQAVIKYISVSANMSNTLLLHLADEFRGLPGKNLQTETLPTTEGHVGAADVLFAAQPWAGRMVASLLRLGVTAPAQTGGSTTPTTGAPSPPTTIPPDVVTNTEPEPWNPVPCTP